MKPRSLKKDKRYKDAPRFKAIYAYEDAFKDSYKKHMDMMIKEVTKSMSDSIRKIKKSSIDELKKAVTQGDIELQTRDIAGDMCYYARVKGQSYWSFITEDKYLALQG